MRASMCVSQPPRTRRPGFTLVEMLIVIMIIGILAALVAAGAFQVIGTQRSSNTELVLKKVEEALLRQWRKVIDQASKEPIPEVYLNQQVDPSGQLASWGLLDMAGGDIKRARVIWIKLRLKHEFPQNILEVLYPNGSGPNAAGTRREPYIGRPDANGRFVTYLPHFTFPQFPPKPTYYHALRNAQVINSPTVPSENSGLLLLALTQGRTGGDFNPDDLGAGALGDAVCGRPQYPLSPDPSNPLGFTAGNIALKQIVDAWNNPVVFWRWPMGNAEVQAGNPASGASLSEKFRDPVDPEGLLVHSSWNSWANYSSFQGVWAFEMLFHSVHAGGNQPWYTSGAQARAYYSTPMVASAGKNLFLGIGPPTLDPRRPPGSPAWPPPQALWPDHMVSDGSQADNDNIYSTRLRLGARGD